MLQCGNTFRIDFGRVPKKPGFVEINDFVRVKLQMKREEIKKVQISKTLGCVFVQTSDLETAQRIVNEHDNIHEYTLDGTSYKLRITLEDGAVEVKVHDLSENVTNEKITKFLSGFGKVLSIREDYWDTNFFFGGLPNGIRIARVLVKGNIPSYVSIENETTLITYAGQRITCRHCGESAHNGASCVQNKKLQLQKLSIDAPSGYANAVKQQTKLTKQSAVPIPKTTHPNASEEVGSGSSVNLRLLNLRSKPHRATSIAPFKTPAAMQNTTTANTPTNNTAATIATTVTAATTTAATTTATSTTIMASTIAPTTNTNVPDEISSKFYRTISASESCESDESSTTTSFSQGKKAKKPKNGC